MRAVLWSRMAPSIGRNAGQGLERSCAATGGDWIRVAPSQPGLERIDARFRGRAFEPHRHDTYTLAVTLDGVQSFDYRGAVRHSLKDQALVLHPDERHDGRAGTEGGFRYRALYVEPRLIAEALGASALPFVRQAVTDDRRLVAALGAALADLDGPLEPLQRDEILRDVADALAALDGSMPRRPTGTIHGPALEAARRLLEESLSEPLSAERLESATGLDRYSLAR